VIVGGWMWCGVGTLVGYLLKTYRMEIVRHWEFLKWLFMTGKLEG